MSSFAKKLMKTTGSELISKSDHFDPAKKYECPLDTPAIAVAMSGEIDGGLMRGIHMILGPSKHFKSNIALKQCSNFLDAHEDSYLYYLNAEDGIPIESFEYFGIDANRVIHKFATNVEEMKQTLSKVLEAMQGEETRIIILVDSISQIASSKEVNDALNEKEVADMTRAKSLNSMFRIITPKLNMLRIPCLIINSTYEDISNKYADPIVKGGKQATLSCNSQLLMGRRVVKDNDKNLVGYNFIMNLLKSRAVKEKSAIPLTVKFDGGIEKMSGVFEWAVAGGFIEAEGKRYKYADILGIDDNKLQWRKHIEFDEEYLTPILENDNFKEYVKDMFQLNRGKANSTFVVDETTGEMIVKTAEKE